jgi:hypothetical protein
MLHALCDSLYASGIKPGEGKRSPGAAEHHPGEAHRACQERGRGLSSRFVKEKELTDRALKLAEVGKPKSNWELQGILGLTAFVLGFLTGK